VVREMSGNFSVWQICVVRENLSQHNFYNMLVIVCFGIIAEHFVAYLMVTILLMEHSMTETILLPCIEKCTARICVDKFCASIQFHLYGKAWDKMRNFSVCFVLLYPASL